MDHQGAAQVPPQPVAAPTATGTTLITDTAVAKVAAAAARTVPGVYSLGAGSNRALGALRGAVAGGPEPAPGVVAEVGSTQVAVDLVLTAVYGRPLHDIAADVRAAVYTAVERLTGLQVIEVNVEIGDVHLPGLPERGAAAGGASAGTEQVGAASAAEPGPNVQAPVHGSRP